MSNKTLKLMGPELVCKIKLHTQRLTIPAEKIRAAHARCTLKVSPLINR